MLIFKQYWWIILIQLIFFLWTLWNCVNYPPVELVIASIVGISYNPLPLILLDPSLLAFFIVLRISWHDYSYSWKSEAHKTNKPLCFVVSANTQWKIRAN